MIRIIGTTVEYEENPVGIPKDPAFSWKIAGDHGAIHQRAYEIRIARDAAFADIVFRKEAETPQSVHVLFPEWEMESLTRYYWQVAVKTTDGERSGFSETASFVTALLTANEWQGEMVSAETPEDAGNSKGTYVRKEFRTEKAVRSAYLCATAYGLYQAYLDGARVGADELTPGWTSYHKHLTYQTYDVTKQLQNSGEKCHCLGAMLGAGYYKGKMGFLKLRNNYGAQTGFLAQLTITYEDGTREIVATDETWMGADSPILFAEIYDGEIYDAGKEIEGWCEAGLAAEENWRAVEILPCDKRMLTAQYGSKVGEQERLPARKIFTTPEGDTVIDFGQNHAGWIHIEIRNARPGEVVELDCFESLDAAGNVYVENLRTAKNRFLYICRGGAEESYHPHFTYQGYRYAKVASWAGDALTLSDVCAYAVYSRMEQTGSFACSNPDLNQLWSNITWSLRSNFVDIPTDCPQRDERLGWTGDAQIFCPTASFIRGTYLFFEKWLRDVACDQTAEGGVPHVVPDIITPNIDKVEDWLCSQGTHSAAAWADVAVLNPWNLYLIYGDERILTGQYESMKRWIQFMEQHAEGMIWNYRLQFGDWVALDAEEGSYFGATPNDLTCTAYYAHSTGIFAKIAAILGKREDAAYYSNLGQKIKRGFAEKFFDPSTGGMTVQTQTAHIIALYFDLTPDEYREQTVRELVELLAKEKGHLVTGFVGTPYFTHALSRNGHVKEAYELLLKEDFPSWLYQVKAGATTIWEHWDGRKPDGSMWSADMNSFNHYAYGAIGEWLVQAVAGICCDENRPGYRHVNLAPQPGGGLTAAEGVFQSVYGEIRCGWESEQDRVKIHIELPANTTGTLHWGKEAIELENGKSDFVYLFSTGQFQHESAACGRIHD